MPLSAASFYHHHATLTFMRRERLTFHDVPLLAVYDRKLELAVDKGCILVFHGLGASKEVQLGDLEEVAERGFLVVGVDNVGHGDRRYPDFDERLSRDNPDYKREFTNAVAATAREVPPLVDALTKAGYIKQERVGALGISMGGFITYSAIPREPRLKVAATIVASPEWVRDLPESPHRHLEGFDTVRLLSQTGGRDTTVPSRSAREFHERLKEFYPDYDERFAYVEYPGADHSMGVDWEPCWQRTLTWFEQHLAPPS